MNEHTVVLAGYNNCSIPPSFFREGESSSAWSRTMETEDNATAHHVPGLQPFTTYMFRVAARNALGFSKPSRESYPTMTHREREYYSMY